MKRPLNAATANDVKAADGNQSECPADIEGKYEGQNDAGKKLVLEISRNSDAQLQVSMSADGGASVAQTVDGQEHSADDGSTIKLTCGDNAIVSVGTVNGVEFSGSYIKTEAGVDINQTSPENKTRSFVRSNQAPQ